MNTKRVTETVKKSNPLEDVFNLPSGSTEITVSKPVSETKEIELYDEKDEEIDKQFDVVKDMAQYTFETIQDQIQDIEPKYSARMHEVASSYLSIMLDSIKSKGKMKLEKDKLHIKKASPTKINQTTNNTIISNTTDIIESLRNGSLNTLEGEFTIKQEDEDDKDS